MLNSFNDVRRIEVLTLGDATISDMKDFLTGSGLRISLDPENFVNHYDAMLGVLHEAKVSPFSAEAVPLTRTQHIVKVNSKIVGVYDDEQLEKLFLS